MGFPINFAEIDLSTHGLGVAVIVLLWSFMFIGTLMTLARLYTRRYLVGKLGQDDLWAAISIVIYAIFAALSTVAVSRALRIPPKFSFSVLEDAFATAKYIWIAGNVLAVLSFTTKATVIIFMLRFIIQKWHRRILWLCLLLNGVVCALIIIIQLARCDPMEKAWKPITPGKCRLNSNAVVIATSVWSSLVDFILALLPWLTIWKLQMKRHDRLLISISLSLGIFAGITGIVRTCYAGMVEGRRPIMELCRAIVASGAEVFVTIVCATVPTLRPLYLKMGGQQSALQYELGKGGQVPRSGSIEKQPLNSISKQSCGSGDIVTTSGKSFNGYGVHVTKETTLSFEQGKSFS